LLDDPPLDPEPFEPEPEPDDPAPASVPDEVVPEDVVPESPPPALESEVVAVPSPPAAAASPSFFFDPLEDDLRSTFAQPDPLKWTVGARNALRTGAPQTGHDSGPGAWMPCITSVRWPLAQTYS
jgi:hypothetical protein